MTDKQIIIDKDKFEKAENEPINQEAVNQGKEIYAELKAENEELKKELESTKGLVTVGNRQLSEALKENEELKKILHYPKYRNEEGIKELKTKSVDYLIDEIVGNHQYMEGKSQAVYKPMMLENNKLKQTLAEIKEIAEPYQKEIKKICGNCNNYDDCHACCKFDLNCYQYKKGDTTACEKFIMFWKYDINELANKILQKINEVEE